jgi:hypothetical protein
MFNVPELEVCERYKNDILDLEQSLERTNNFSENVQPVLCKYFSKKYSNSSTHNNVPLNIFFPYWLSENYRIDKALRESVIIAGIYYSEYLLINDSLIDAIQKISHKKRRSLHIIANVFFTKALKILREIFPLASSFWKLHDEYMSEYWDVIAWEAQFCSRIRPWSNDNIQTMGIKLAPLKMAAAAFTLFAGRRKELPILEKLVEYFHVGMQMLDDIDDWREDLARRNYTYFLSLAASDINSRKALTHKLIIKRIPETALLQTLITSKRYFQKAMGFATKMDLKSLQEFILFDINAVSNIIALTRIYPKAILVKGTSNLLVGRRSADQKKNKSIVY